MKTINYRRYEIASPWRRTGFAVDPFEIEYADLRDKRTGDVYADGAARVVNADGVTVNERGEPAARRVFAGETAWMSAESVLRDAALATRFGRAS